MNNKIILILFFLFSSAFAQPQEIYSFAERNENKRFFELTNEIRCVVCQGQSIADSNAPLAKDLRQKIYDMIVEKKSNTDIKNYLVKRYGEFILLKPSINKFTILLWIFPFFGLGIIFLFFIK